MVSDIVLLKELPAFIKNSVAAYIGCVAGAIHKDEYIGAMETAGFQETGVTDGASVKWIADDAAAKTFSESLKIPPEELEEIASSIISVRVHGIKPG